MPSKPSHELPLRALKRSTDFAPIWAAGVARNGADLAALASSGALYRAFASEAARDIVSKSLVADATMEFILTVARRGLLFELTQTDTKQIDSAKLGFLCALGQQCFLNEYVYWEEPDETSWVELLEESLLLVSRGDEEPLRPHLVALFACYRPLVTLNLPSHAVGALKCVGEIAPLITHAIEESQQEKKIAGELQTMTPIRDAVSVRVRAQ